MKAKQMITIVACVTMILSMAACGDNNSGDSGKAKVKMYDSSETVANNGENVQIPNPWTECSDIEEAEKKQDFHLTFLKLLKVTRLDGFRTWINL